MHAARAEAPNRHNADKMAYRATQSIFAGWVGGDVNWEMLLAWEAMVLGGQPMHVHPYGR